MTVVVTGHKCTGSTKAVNAVSSKLYHTAAYSRGEVAVLVGLIGTGAHHLSCNDTLVLVTIVEQTVHELRKTVNDQF